MGEVEAVAEEVCADKCDYNIIAPQGGSAGEFSQGVLIEQQN